MHDVIDLKEDIYAKNDHIAEHINEYLKKKEIFAINIMGAPGIGKTTLIINIIDALKTLDSKIFSFVIEGDIESSIDTEKLRSLSIPAYQINTFGACHLDAPMLHNAITNIDFKKGGFLFIENVGNLVCPAEFSIGEHMKVLICSVTEGSDKPYKYPLAFERANLILLNKVDLIPHLDFDENFFKTGIRRLNHNVNIIKTSINDKNGYEKVAKYLIQEKQKI
jgi:hydrogenase nickel incorporation protein HypB